MKSISERRAHEKAKAERCEGWVRLFDEKLLPAVILVRGAPTGGFSAIGIDPVEFIPIRYRHDDSFIRFFPRIRFRDIDDASFIPILNGSLAKKLKAIHIYANGYKLQEIGLSDFSIDGTQFDAKIPVEFSIEELGDPWVRIRPKIASSFTLSFSDQTPRRLFLSRKTPDSLADRR
jgi:hypothetical protein